MVFFWDPLEAQPHDVDVKALLRLAVVWNIPMACNRVSADFMFSSPLMVQQYSRILPDYADVDRASDAYIERVVGQTDGDADADADADTECSGREQSGSDR